MVGGDVSVSMGGAASVSGGRSGSAVFGDGMSVTGGSTVSAEASEGLSLMARDVDVRGAEGVRVSGAGSVVELGGGAGKVEYVSFTWRSSSSFTAFSNAVPLVAGAEEVIIRSSVAGGALLSSSAGGATASLSVQSSVGGAWTTVWSTTVGAGLYSLDGLHVRFVRQDVAGVQLSVSGGGSFDGWDAVVLHFGRASTGVARVASAGMLDVVSGDAVVVASEAAGSASSSRDGARGGGGGGRPYAACKLL